MFEVILDPGALSLSKHENEGEIWLKIWLVQIPDKNSKKSFLEEVFNVSPYI